MVLLVVPALVVISIVLFAPLLSLMRLSAGSGAFEPYGKALGDPLYYGVIWSTFRIAAATTVICLILAYPLAYFITTTSPRVRAFCLMLVVLPFWTSVLVRTYAWMVLLGRNGVINRFLLEHELTVEPLPLIYNVGGVLLGTVYYLVPFMVLPIYAAMARIDRNLLLAAEGLGAPAWQIFCRIYFPLTLKGVIAGVALVFILGLSAFVTPALLGGGRVIMISNLIYTQVSELLNWSFASALSGVILLTTITVYAALSLMTRRSWT
ncbi:ABC transporter permease [Microvirga sp. M2]|uniref:ABC transporter permease n=1 Tax=Microvirga sp. M2 TaxID=3073270 RepID=UPI0039C204B2